MLMPKRVKHRKVQRGPDVRDRQRWHDRRVSANTVWSLWNGLDHQPPDRSRTTRHDRSVKRGGKIWIRIFPDKPATKKPAETRNGFRQGCPRPLVAVVKPGRILFEMAGVDRAEAVEAMRLAGHKLPVATRSSSRKASQMDIEKVRGFSDGELEEQLRQAKQDLWQARFALTTRQLKDYSSIPQTRRTIARILTVQRERRDERSRTQTA